MISGKRFEVELRSLNIVSTNNSEDIAAIVQKDRNEA